MKDGSKYVGLDVHKETIAVSIADAYGGDGEFTQKVEVSVCGHGRTTFLT